MSNGLIIGLTFSIVINILVVFFLLFTGIGKDAWQRFWWKKMHRRGGYSYSLVATKDGNLKEVFKQHDKGLFSYEDLKYSRDPRKQIQFRGLPVNIHVEGNPVPISIWDESERDASISCAEIDEVLLAQQNNDLFALIEKYKSVVIIGAVVLIGLLAASTFFGYSVYEMLRDGAVNMVSSAVEVAPN